MEPLSSEPREWEPEIALEGDIDCASVLDVWHQATGAMNRFGPYLTLDLSRVTFIDVVGIGALVHVQEEAARRGGRLTLASVPPKVDRVIHLTHVEERFAFRAP
jgi:anti-sigma B factor antagonist